MPIVAMSKKEAIPNKDFCRYCEIADACFMLNAHNIIPAIPVKRYVCTSGKNS